MAILRRRGGGAEEATDAEVGTTTEKGSSSETTRAGQPGAGAAPAGKAVPSTRVSSAWTAVAVGLFFLIALLIFIFQNLQNVRVTFITVHGSFPLALWLLCAAIAGALIVLTLGVSRVIQLRRVARRHRDTAIAASRSSSD